MTSPLLALRGATLSGLAGDAALAALMGGHLRLYDEPPRGSAPVYALFGDATARDDSVDGAERHAHDMQLIVVGRTGSARSALDAAERIAALMPGLPPDLDGHRLVLLRIARLTANRDERTGETRATLTVTAVTEVASSP